MGLIDELERLATLRESGALSESEFQSAKRKLIGEPHQPFKQQWERAEIKPYVAKKRSLLDDKWIFAAEAVNPDRTYRAAESREFTAVQGFQDPGPDGHDERVRKIYREFIADLANDGWEALPDQGVYWWSKTLRRRYAQA